MYRAAALFLLREQVGLADQEGLDRVLPGLRIHQAGTREFLGEEDVTDLLRTPQLATLVSAAAANPRVREVLVAQQRRTAASGNWVVDGRDIGVTVFPDACCKIFLTASLEARAQRRFLELQGRGAPQPLETVVAELRRRDQGVLTRAVAPLKMAEDAVLLDTSALSLEQAAGWIVRRHRAHGQAPGHSC